MPRYLSYVLTISLLASAGATQAQLADNATVAQQDSGTVLAQAQPSAAPSSIDSTINDPNAQAEDLGLASPGTSISLPSLESN